jgi:hypothetical protein
MNSPNPNKKKPHLHPRASERLCDKDPDRSVMHRIVLLLAFSATIAAIIVTILHLGTFWHYFWLTTCLVFSILTFLEVHRLGEEIAKGR